MSILLIFIPILIATSAAILYRQNGKKEILKFDLVQFLYAFVIPPMLFIWMKTFIFFLIHKDIQVHLNAIDSFLIDTTASTVFLYFFAFIVIHSLTKSFEMKRRNDPFHDLVQHAEYFHTWFTHIGIYAGAMLVFTILAALNLFLTLPLGPSPVVLPLIVFGGVVLGGFTYYSSHQYYYGFHPFPEDALKVGRYSFMTIMKVLYALFFLIHIVMYFLASPRFTSMRGFYWFSFTIFATLVVNAFFMERSKRARAVWRKLKYSRRKKQPRNIELKAQALELL